MHLLQPAQENTPAAVVHLRGYIGAMLVADAGHIGGEEFDGISQNAEFLLIESKRAGAIFRERLAAYQSANQLKGSTND